MDLNRDREVPVMVRRRRKQTYREQTPDPSQRSVDPVKYTDEDNSSQTSEQTSEYRRTKGGTIVKTSSNVSGHRSKILGKRDKAIGTTSGHRSQSQPKIAPEQEAPVQEVLSDRGSDMTALMKQATRRSQSTPRKREESDDSGQCEKLRRRINQKPVDSVSSASHHRAETAQLEQNMRRFEEEQRKFEMEKLRFLEEKRQLDKIRLLRFEKYRQGAFTEPKNEPIKGPADNRYDRARMDNLNIQKHLPEPSPSSTDQSARRATNLKDRKRRSRTRRDEDESSPIESSSEEVEKIRHRARSILTPKDQKPKMVEKLPDMHVEPKVEEKIEDEPIEVEHEEEQNIKTEETVEKPEHVDAPQAEIATTEETPKPSPPPSPKIDTEPKPSLLSRFFGIFKSTPKAEEEKKDKTKTENSSKEDTTITDKKPDPEVTVAEKEDEKIIVKTDDEDKLTKMKILKLAYREIRDNWAPFKLQHKDNVIEIKKSLNKCFTDLLLLCILCGIGGLLFRTLEGNYENSYKCGVRKVKRDFIDQLWLSSHNMREDDWKSMARTRLRKFEDELQVAFHAAGTQGYTGHTVWNFVNGVLFCWTVITTIGYGHITPATTTGKIVTIIYAIIGIPLFLILLADFGKLFTRGIKFLWAYVRRLYYTGSCRKVRKTSQVQDVMRGVTQVMDIVRRPSQAVTNYMSSQNEIENGQELPQTPHSQPPPDTPQTEISEMVVDDEFNLPISLAIFILLAYMIVGALVYYTWESSWSLFESFYFVFISMSTIGFGDYVPEHPMYMMCSIVYLIFGLALTSMCINVVQMKLSDSFRMASAKIGATIGLQLAQQSQQGSQPESPIGDGGSTPREPPTVDGAPPLPSKSSLSSRNSSPQRPPKKLELTTPNSERKLDKK